MSRNLHILLCLTQFIQFINTQSTTCASTNITCIGDTKSILNDVMATYNRNHRPVRDAKRAVQVSVKARLRTIYALVCLCLYVCVTINYRKKQTNHSHTFIGLIW
jgi:hypothetical protein